MITITATHMMSKQTSTTQKFSCSQNDDKQANLHQQVVTTSTAQYLISCQEVKTLFYNHA
jgi:hypothetical protein